MQDTNDNLAGGWPQARMCGCVALLLAAAVMGHNQLAGWPVCPLLAR